MYSQIRRLYDLSVFPITCDWEMPPVNIYKANWLFFSPNLHTSRCSQTQQHPEVACSEASVTPTSIFLCFILLSHFSFAFKSKYCIFFLCFNNICSKGNPGPLALWCSCVAKKAQFQHTALLITGESLLLPIPTEPPNYAALDCDFGTTHCPEELWMSYWWRCSRPSWMELWTAWSVEVVCAHVGEEVGTRWSLRPLWTQIILWFLLIWKTAVQWNPIYAS